MTRAVKKPAWRLFVRGVDATNDLMPLASEIVYRDKAHGEADGARVTLADDGRFRSGRWLPERTSRLALQIGYEDEPLSDSGALEIDEIAFANAPDTVTFKATSAPASQALRSAPTTQFDDTTLAGVARAIAERRGLTVVGEIRPIAIPRLTQHERTGLAFPRELAGEYGHVFKVTAEKPIFHELAALDGPPSVMTLGPADLAPKSTLKLSTVGGYGAAIVEYTDPGSGETRTARAAAAAADAAGGDIPRRRIEAFSPADAKAKAQAALYRANRATGLTGSPRLEGAASAVAGATIALAGFGSALDGLYKIETATHRPRGGAAWATDIEVEGLAHD